jgi:hypothetical protein
VLLLSCKKEDLSNGLNPGNTVAPVLSKILVNNQSTYEYIYNDSNLISEEKSTFDFKLNHYNNIGQLVSTEYYGNDDIFSSDAQVSATAVNSVALITLVTGKKGGTITYEYNANSQLIKTTYALPSSASSEYSEFNYDANNRISRQTMYWVNATTGYIDYSYDGKGNLIKEMLYNLPTSGVAELITTTSYNFDNQQNPYKQFRRLMIPGINTNQNNIIKETYTIHLTPDQGSDKVQITETSYEYNAMGYPVSSNGNISYVYQ